MQSTIPLALTAAMLLKGMVAQSRTVASDRPKCHVRRWDMTTSGSSQGCLESTLEVFIANGRHCKSIASISLSW